MSKLKAKYKLAKAAKVGEVIACPSCDTLFKKETYQQTFCKHRGGTKCKDAYWNKVDPKKRNNTTRISPASARYSASKISHFDNITREDIEDSIHPHDSDALGQW